MEIGNFSLTSRLLLSGSVMIYYGCVSQAAGTVRVSGSQGFFFSWNVSLLKHAEHLPLRQMCVFPLAVMTRQMVGLWALGRGLWVDWALISLDVCVCVSLCLARRFI